MSNGISRKSRAGQGDFEVLRIADVARQLRVSVRVVYRMVKAGEIDCFRVGDGRGSLRFRPWAAEDYVKRQETKSRRRFQVAGGLVR